MPVRNYSSGMRSRLTFGAAMGIQFDTYLIDEVTAVGDAAFRRKSRAVFRERMKTSGAIMVSHDTRTVREFCDAGLVLERGQLHYFEDLEDAILGEWLEIPANVDTSELAAIQEIFNSLPKIRTKSSGQKAFAFS